MPRKVMLSFVGTGNYVPCRYALKGQASSQVVTYVQKALATYYFEERKPDDRIILFLTEKAVAKHGDSILKELDGYPVKSVKGVPESFSEEDNWRIFSMVFDELQQDDEVILDITHAFRSYVVLASVMMSYAKALKNIRIVGIYYGAFEILGSSYSINERFPDENSRIVPLVDMSIYSELQDWSYAAASYVDTGNPFLIKKRVDEFTKSRVVNSQLDVETYNEMHNLVSSLEDLESQLSTCRAKELSTKNSINKAKDSLRHLMSQNKQLPKAFSPILENINQNIHLLDRGIKVIELLPFVEVCIRNGKTQQGITMLLEGLISEVCILTNLDFNSLNDREIVSQSINIYKRKIPFEKWKKESKENKEKVEKIISEPNVQILASKYMILSNYRNDINHAGYRDNPYSSGDMISGLNLIFNDIKSVLNGTKN